MWCLVTPLMCMKFIILGLIFGLGFDFRLFSHTITDQPTNQPIDHIPTWWQMFVQMREMISAWHWSAIALSNVVQSPELREGNDNMPIPIPIFIHVYIRLIFNHIVRHGTANINNYRFCLHYRKNKRRKKKSKTVTTTTTTTNRNNNNKTKWELKIMTRNDWAMSNWANVKSGMNTGKKWRILVNNNAKPDRTRAHQYNKYQCITIDSILFCVCVSIGC